MNFTSSKPDSKRSAFFAQLGIGTLLFLASLYQLPNSSAYAVPQKLQLAQASHCPGLLARGTSEKRSVTICRNDDNKTFYMVLRDRTGDKETSLPASLIDNNFNAFVAKNGNFTYTVDYSNKKLTIVQRIPVPIASRYQTRPPKIIYRYLTTTEVLSAILMS